MLYCTFPSPFSSGFGRTGSNVFLPPVFPVKLWKGQMSSGGQFLHHLNTRNCVGCLHCTGGAGSKTQSDRPRSRHKGKDLWAELWWVPVLAASFTIYFHTCVCACSRPRGRCPRALPAVRLLILFGSLWVYIHLHCGDGCFCATEVVWLQHEGKTGIQWLFMPPQSHSRLSIFSTCLYAAQKLK